MLRNITVVPGTEAKGTNASLPFEIKGAPVMNRHKRNRIEVESEEMSNYLSKTDG